MATIKITGNAYESHGKIYARVSLGVEIDWPKGRTSRPNIALTTIADLASAKVRAEFMADRTRALVAAGVRLDVAVDDAHLVCNGQALGRFCDQRKGPRE